MDGAVNSSLRIHRLRSRYLVPLNHPRPDNVRARLDHAVQVHLVTALQAALRPALENDVEGILLIRRLETHLALDASGLDEAVLGQAIGRGIAAQILRLAAHPTDLTNVRYFPDWASYAVQYALDRLSGMDGSAWYYRPFDGLRSLDLSQALSAALLLRPEAAARSLLQIARGGNMFRLLRALSETDARRILDALRRPAAPSQPHRSMLPVLLDGWIQPVSPHAEPGSARHLLALWAAWVNQPAPAGGVEQSPFPPDEFWACTSLLVDITHLLSAAADRSALLDRLLAHDLPAALALSGPNPDAGNAVRLGEILRFFASDSRLLADTAARLAPLPEIPRPALTGQLSSNCGGWFWLLPSLLALRPQDWLDESAPDAQTTAIWRYWLALKCLGAPRWEQARTDPGLMLSLGLEQVPDGAAWRAAADALAGPPGADLLRRLWLVLYGQHRVNGSPLAQEDAHLPGGGTVYLLRDTRRDDWLYLADNADELGAAAVEIQSAFGHDPQTGAVFSFGAPLDPSLNERMGDFTRKARPAAGDLEYLHLPGLPLAADLALTPAARAVLRTFAGRLMGFAWSSLPYLYENFLSGAALVETAPRMLRVHLPSPPLHSVLRLTGFQGEELAPPWLNGRELHLLWEEAG